MHQHAQAHCQTCQRPTLHVRNSYDVPHVGHLILVCAFGLAAAVNPLWPLFAGAALAWLAVWAAHTAVNWLSVGPPYRCQVCGSTPAIARGDDEAQRLERAMAKAAAMKARAGAAS